MSELPIVRAAHLLLYADVLREIGAPVDRELARSRLPTWIEETPDAYVSIPLALDWVARCSRDTVQMELGYLAAGRMTLATLDLAVQAALANAPTGFAQIEALSRVVHRENSALVMWTRREGEQLRIVCDLPQFRSAAALGFAEWLNLHEIVAIVRTIAGPAWCPAEMTFHSRSRPANAVLEVFGNTRILFDRPETSLVVASDVLAKRPRRPPAPGQGTPSPAAAPDDGWNFVAKLEAAIRPYLGNGAPDLDLAAEMAGMTKRTFQRRLGDLGLTYKHLVRNARFGIACDLLVDPANNIIDVAFAAGYENPQHFSRAFRQVAGVTPSKYRTFAGQL